MSKQMALHTVTIEVYADGNTYSFEEQYLSETLAIAFVSSDPNVEVVMVSTTLVPEEHSAVLSRYLYKNWYIQDGRIEVNGNTLEPLQQA